MAFETGSETDRLLMLEALRDFITGASSPASGLSWTALRDTSGDSPIPTEYEMIFRGFGDGSPEDAIYWGIKTYTGAGPYGWEIRGMKGYIAANTFEEQPGIGPPAYIPLRDGAAMNYWFFANETHVKGVIQTGTAYQPFYAGFPSPRFVSATDWPYPLFIAGSSYNNAYAFNNNSLDYATFPHPGSTTTVRTSSCYLLWIDGQWVDFKHYSGTSSENPIDDRGIWPMMYDQALPGTDFPTHYDLGGVNTIRRVAGTSAGGGTTAVLFPSPGSPECPPLFPCILHTFNPSRQIIGELQDVFWVSGQGLAAEDTIVDNTVSPAQTYIVFQNVHRTDNWMYFAIRQA